MPDISEKDSSQESEVSDRMKQPPYRRQNQYNFRKNAPLRRQNQYRFKMDGPVSNYFGSSIMDCETHTNRVICLLQADQI